MSQMIRACILLLEIDVSRPIFTGLGKYFKHIEAITIYRKGFFGKITKKTFEGAPNITKLIIKNTNIDGIDKESLHMLKDLKGSTEL